MEIERYNKLIDDVLKELYTVSPQNRHLYYVLKDITNLPDEPPKNELSNLTHSIIDKLKYLDLIENVGDYKHKISQKGIGIVDCGGYCKYLLAVEKEILHEQMIEEIADKKLIVDSKLSEWQKKTFWYVFFLGVLGFLIALITLLAQLGLLLLPNLKK